MKNKAAQELGKLGGSVKSEAKTASSRANGSKGGRPKGYIRNICGFCSKIHYLKPIGYHHWVGACPDCGAEFNKPSESSRIFSTKGPR